MMSNVIGMWGFESLIRTTLSAPRHYALMLRNEKGTINTEIIVIEKERRLVHH
jgi:hypothetical protein